jgi:hypothetical protein
MFRKYTYPLDAIKNKLSLFRTIDYRLNIGLALSLICIIYLNFIFNKTQELFYGGAKLGEILTNLSLAFIASYIFYFVTA